VNNRIVNFVLFVIAVTVIIGGAALLGSVSGAVDLWRAQNAARLAEAEAVKLQAELELTRARADVETAQGQRAVLEAAARSVDADRRLTEYYARRGDLRAVLALVGALGLAVTGGALFVIIKGVNDGSKNKNADN